MPITTKNDDILISFSYEYPMDDKNLALDFSLFYKDDNLALKVKNGSKNVGTFPVAMFKEVLDFLSSKGYVSSYNDVVFDSKGGVAKDVIADVEDVLKIMSSDTVDVSPAREDVKVDTSSKAIGDDPIQSFSVNYSSGGQLQPGGSADRQDSDDSMSVGRFRNDINYVDSGNVPSGKSNNSSSDSSIKRS
ncbi:hypothetical protein CMI47_04680 [Candidatus Pacearchaeota archaeon]|jgi:hypothetical protein|nr:hypothetical protein [Candidatus Pacearchaeota archaeon]|tara:strand:+ start:15715 stop:16284 length:570 start_codon:yes stop_codon:yes gene_type:complete